MTPELATEERTEVLTTELAAVMKKLERLYDIERHREVVGADLDRMTREEIKSLEARWAQLEVMLAF